jgi:hypothetical protein
MSLEDPGSATFAGIGGLNDQVRELREIIELPLLNPELFEVSGINGNWKRAEWKSEWVSHRLKVSYCMDHQAQVRQNLLYKVWANMQVKPCLHVRSPQR